MRPLGSRPELVLIQKLPHKAATFGNAAAAVQQANFVTVTTDGSSQPRVAQKVLLAAPLTSSPVPCRVHGSGFLWLSCPVFILASFVSGAIVRSPGGESESLKKEHRWGENALMSSRNNTRDNG